MPRRSNRMVYLGGHSSRKGVVGVLAFPEKESDEREFTVFYTTDGSQWRQLQFEFDVTSVTYMGSQHGNKEGWWLVGKRGEVVSIIGGVTSIDKIDTAGTGPGRKYGYLSRIRVIGNELYICGYRRQVYRQVGSSWKLVSGDIIDSGDIGPWNGFESIDGFAPDDIYAVGDDGEIWHFNGVSWHACASPTNATLADVRCINDIVWACGDGGIILQGRWDNWDVVWSDEEPSESWWSLEYYGGHVYVAGDDFLGRLENGQVVPVSIDGKSDITTLELHAKDGILWSIGESDILSFDGTRWLEHVCPENQ